MDPLLTGAGLALLGGYALVVVLLGTDYLYTGGGAHYLSPFYSPDLETIFGFDVPFSTALLVVWAPLGLRATCYYYRKTYYRSYFLAPPACAVRGAARPGKYAGESRLPLILQNAHRYFFYVALVVLGFLWYDAIRAFFFDGSVGLGLGTLVLVLNASLLTMFTLGCNSLRHMVGGRLDCFSCSARARTRHRLWKGVTVLNLRHKEWAWLSLFWVCFADLYVRLCAMGVWTDWRLF